MQMQCSICFEAAKDPHVSDTQHVYCKECADTWTTECLRVTGRPTSPSSRGAWPPKKLRVEYLAPTTSAPTPVLTGIQPGQVLLPSARHIVAILDCSSSMAYSSKTSDTNAPSRISLMIHLVKMVARVLQANNWLFSIVKFNSHATVVANRSPAVSNEIIQSLQPEFTTDMTLALSTAVAQFGLDPTYILFTDGEPNQGTEHQVITTAVTFGSGFKLDVVGFGPYLNNDVMSALAVNGTYTYIYDVMTSSVMMSSLLAFIMTGRASVPLDAGDEYLRSRFVPLLGMLQSPTASATVRGHTIEKILHGLSGLHGGSPYCQALREDVKSLNKELGQIEKATQYYWTWGKYYLSAIYSAHNKKYTMSDLESSLQFYGTPEFSVLRGTFVQLIRDIAYFPVSIGDVQNLTAVSTVVERTTGAARDRGGCFTPGSKVLLACGDKIPVEDLRRGDRVSSIDKNGQEVVGVVDCLVKILVDQPLNIYGGFITGYHPIAERRETFPALKWQFPCTSMPNPDCLADGYVYNVMLQEGACVVHVNDHLCITLGHDTTDDPVAAHPYFGSTRVREDLLALMNDGDGGGIVNIRLSAAKHGEDGLVSNIY